jgi:hypothetical protein
MVQAMKILFLDNAEFTSGTRFLWQGLNEILGPENVYDYPPIPILHQADSYLVSEQDWYQRMSQQVRANEIPTGIPPFAPGELLTVGADEQKRHYYSPKFQDHQVRLTEDIVVQMLKNNEFTLIVLGNTHRIPTINLARLKARVNNLPPVVYFDAGERDELNEHWVHVFKPDLVFKQILTPAVLNRGLTTPIPKYKLRMFPLPLSSTLVDYGGFRLGAFTLDELRTYDNSPQKFLDVFYALGNTWPKRDEVTATMDQFRKNRDLNYVWRANCNEVCGNYYMILSRSCYVISMRGSGRDTTRYWEIPMFETAMICDGTMGCLHPYPFEDNKTAIFYRSIDELYHIANSWIKGREGERIDIAKAGKKHLWQYHSTAARALFFLETIQKNLGCIDKQGLERIFIGKQHRQWDDRDWRGPVVGCE